jgi:hypothetical protein
MMDGTSLYESTPGIRELASVNGQLIVGSAVPVEEVDPQVVLPWPIDPASH